MAEPGTDAANDLLNELMGIMIQLGVASDEVKARLYMVMHGYRIEHQSTDLIPYAGDYNSDLLKRFLLAKAVAGRSKNTIRMYGNVIRNALIRIGKQADEITPDDIRYYIAMRMRDGVTLTTINNELRPLSSFFEWMRESEIVSKNVIHRIDKIKEPKKDKKAFTDIEIEMLRANLRNSMEKAIFETLLSTGCRVSEAVSIRTADIKEDGSVLICGKGNKWRTVYMNAKAIVAIRDYLAERKDKSPYLFPRCSVSFQDKGASQIPQDWYRIPEYVDCEKMRDKGGIEYAMRKLGRRSGVENCHPHRFRRTCATMALQRGMPLALVSKMLGHANLGTTQIYLDLDEEDLKQAHRKFVT